MPQSLQCLQADVDEAYRLMKASKSSLVEEGDNEVTQDAVSAAYARLRDDAQSSGKRVYPWSDLLQLLGRQFSVRSLSVWTSIYIYIHI